MPQTPASGQATDSTTASEQELSPPVDGPKLMPVDEASSQPGLQQFRERLIGLAERRDVDAIVAAADPRIRTSFGGGGGHDDFRDLLEREGMLEEFRRVLELGGSMQGEASSRSFWTPYVFSEWPDAFDSFTHAAVTGEQVPLLESRDPGARAVATLSYDIVELNAPSSEHEGWRQVTTADGRTGWIEERHVRSPIDYRAGIARGPGGWKIDIFVAGD